MLNYTTSCDVSQKVQTAVAKYNNIKQGSQEIGYPIVIKYSLKAENIHAVESKYPKVNDCR